MWVTCPKCFNRWDWYAESFLVTCYKCRKQWRIDKYGSNPANIPDPVKTKTIKEELSEIGMWETFTLNQRTKLEVIAHYSPNLVCVKCGFDDIRALQIDHINNDGYLYKEAVKDKLCVTKVYTWLKQHNYPSDYQVLCANCNWEKKELFMGHHRTKRALEVIAHYTNNLNICAKCGNDNITVLTIDHINGNGAAHRRAIKTDVNQWLKRNGYPEGYQVLCHNCQHIKVIENKEYASTYKKQSVSTSIHKDSVIMPIATPTHINSLDIYL